MRKLNGTKRSARVSCDGFHCHVAITTKTTAPLGIGQQFVVPSSGVDQPGPDPLRLWTQL